MSKENGAFPLHVGKKGGRILGSLLALGLSVAAMPGDRGIEEKEWKTSDWSESGGEQDGDGKNCKQAVLEPTCDKTHKSWQDQLEAFEARQQQGQN